MTTYVAQSHVAFGDTWTATQHNQLIDNTACPAPQRVTSITSSATPAPDVDTTDLYLITALAEAAVFGVPTGTPVQGQKLIIRIKDNATAHALSWNAIYRVIGTTLPLTTVISKTLYLGFIYNSTDTKWDLLAVGQET